MGYGCAATEFTNSSMNLQLNKSEKNFLVGIGNTKFAENTA